jgi:hypothetical protein
MEVIIGFLCMSIIILLVIVITYLRDINNKFKEIKIKEDEEDS